MRLFLALTLIGTIASAPIGARSPEETKESERLEKAGARVSNDSSLPEGSRLVVSFDKLDDKTAVTLKGLKHVGKLTVEDASHMTDKSLAVIGTFTGLQELSLTNPAITNAGMSSLKGLKELRKLYLIDAAKVTDAGVGSLKSLDKLEELDLSGSGITNAAGSTFKELPNLTLLAVSKTKFGDTGAAYLKELKSLRKLEAVNTDVSVKAAMALEQAIKGVRVRR
jgi:Leucine-rich repeat (LRR) protein